MDRAHPRMNPVLLSICEKLNPLLGIYPLGACPHHTVYFCRLECLVEDFLSLFVFTASTDSDFWPFYDWLLRFDCLVLGLACVSALSSVKSGLS